MNISGRHLVSPDLIDDVRSALDASGVDASRLIVEVTETVLVDDPIALANMTQLRGLGVAIAIDDFGTGYTSIGQLPRPRIDILKIDRFFVASDGPAHRSLVRLVTEAAHAFGLTVVAEGIERAEQAEEIHALSVDTGQGYYLARPTDAASAARLGSCPALPEGVLAERTHSSR